MYEMLTYEFLLIFIAMQLWTNNYPCFLLTYHIFQNVIVTSAYYYS